jgi:hypothetical protein
VFEAAGFHRQGVRLLLPRDARVSTSRRCRDSLNQIPSGSIVLFHACCHNPTGVDPHSGPVARGGRHLQSPLATALHRLCVSRLRRRHPRRRAGRAYLYRRGPAVRDRVVLLQVVLALSRARGRRVLCGVERGRGQARHLAAEARDPQQLFEPELARRASRWRWCSPIPSCARAGRRK